MCNGLSGNNLKLILKKKVDIGKKAVGEREKKNNLLIRRNKLEQPKAVHRTSEDRCEKE
jgi:hypothetical protein